MTVSRRWLNRTGMLDFLHELASSQAQGALSFYIPPAPSNEPEDLLPERASGAVPPELLELVARSKTGAALFISPAQGYLVLPPLPVKDYLFLEGCSIEPLSSILEHDYTIALVLVRLGSFAIGVCRGEKLLNSKVGTGLVHGRHRQGGSSSQRFRRHREKQIEYFLTRVCEHAREQLEPHTRDIDYTIYGGAWTTILLLTKQCSFLERLNGKLLPPLLDIPEPRQAALEKAVTRAWSSQVIEWHRENQSGKPVTGVSI